MKTYYITTPIYYPNSSPHIGSVYTTVCCDIIARFKRLDGYSVRFVTGTDEHGQKIEQAAERAHVSPQQFVDDVSQKFRQILPLYHISSDDFIRTTELRHKNGAKTFWSKLVEQGDIYKGFYSGWYSVRDETFYAETELVDGKAPTGAPVTWVEEPSYFFRLSDWAGRLLEFYERNPHFIAPETRRNEVISFVKGGLKDLSISRTTFKWGIPVPGDDQHIMYVWIDALTNYINAVGYPDTKGEMFQKFWPADLHVVGKDILRFHAIFWPAFLMAADLAPPKRVFAHGWWTVSGQKMSKSLGNVIDPYAMADRYGADVVRYFMVREISFGNDGDFSEDNLIHRANSQLANELGNLAQRTLSMVHKNCEGVIPSFSDELLSQDHALSALVFDTLNACRKAIDSQELHKYVDEIWHIVRAANKYIDAEAPWILRKTNQDRMKKVLYIVMETLRFLGILIQPLMPQKAKELLNSLSVPEDERDFAHLIATFCLKEGIHIPIPSTLFPRIEIEENAS